MQNFFAEYKLDLALNYIVCSMDTNCTPFVAYLYYLLFVFVVFNERKSMLSQADIIEAFTYLEQMVCQIYPFI